MIKAVVDYVYFCKNRSRLIVILSQSNWKINLGLVCPDFHFIQLAYSNKCLVHPNTKCVKFGCQPYFLQENNMKTNNNPKLFFP